MRAREEAAAEIQERMDEVAEQIRGYCYSLGLAVASSHDSLGIPIGARFLEKVLVAEKDADEASEKLASAEAFMADFKEKTSECEALKDQMGEKNKELKLNRLRLGALVYEQCSLSLLDKTEFAAVYEDAEKEKQLSERKSSDGLFDKLFSMRGRNRLHRNSDARLLSYAELVLEKNLDNALKGENAERLTAQCRECSEALKTISDEHSELIDYIDERALKNRNLERSEYAELKAEAESLQDKLHEELISYGNYLFDRGASWIDQTTPSELLDCLDSILKGQNEYSALAGTLDRIKKEAKADDYKAQIEEERSKILILQKEKERIDMQISQIQAEIDRLEGTIDRLSLK